MKIPLSVLLPLAVKLLEWALKQKFFGEKTKAACEKVVAKISEKKTIKEIP